MFITIVFIFMIINFIFMFIMNLFITNNQFKHYCFIKLIIFITSKNLFNSFYLINLRMTSFIKLKKNIYINYYLNHY